MANFGPIRIYSELSNLTTLPELTRFLSAFTTNLVSNFNGLVSTRDVWGVVEQGGSIVTGEFFGVSHYALGSYWVGFNPALSGTPAVTATSYQSFGHVSVAGVTLTGFYILTASADATISLDVGFNFLAKGPR